MKIKTEHVPFNNEDRVFFTETDDDETMLTIGDMPWSNEVYLVLDDGDNFANIIIKRKHLEKFMKASKPKKAEKKPKKKTTQDKLNALNIGTRFVTVDGYEFIKVGKNAYMETNEKLAEAAFSHGLGFAPAEVFEEKIRVVSD